MGSLGLAVTTSVDLFLVLQLTSLDDINKRDPFLISRGDCVDEACSTQIFISRKLDGRSLRIELAVVRLEQVFIDGSSNIINDAVFIEKDDPTINKCLRNAYIMEANQ